MVLQVLSPLPVQAILKAKRPSVYETNPRIARTPAAATTLKQGLGLTPIARAAVSVAMASLTGEKQVRLSLTVFNLYDKLV